MVERVSNSIPLGNLTVGNKNCSAGSSGVSPTGINNVDSILNADPFSFDSMNTSSLESPAYDMQSMYLDVYGPMVLNTRIFDEYQQNLAQSGYNFETSSVTNEESKLLSPLAERINEKRGPLGKRMFDGSQVTQTLENAYGSGKTVPLYMTYCAKYGGLKDPNKEISFENLKNPLKMAQDVQGHSLGAPNANKNTQILCDASVKERMPEMAASLLMAAKSGMTPMGVDNTTVKKLLVDSKNILKNENDYVKFITDIDKSMQSLYGTTLDNYIKTQYKPAWTYAMPAAGAVIGGIIGSIIPGGGTVAGAAVGSALGGSVFATTWYGASKEGNELLKTVDYARNKDNDVDFNKYLGSSSLNLGGNEFSMGLV